METRGFDAVKGITISQRSKEMAHDYRYFPEPDLQAVYVKDDYIQSVKAELPPLPKELFEKYTQTLQLSDYDAEVITEDKAFALYYEALIKHTSNYKAAANWMMGAVKSYLNDNAKEINKRSQEILYKEFLDNIIAISQLNIGQNFDAILGCLALQGSDRIDASEVSRNQSLLCQAEPSGPET